MSNKFPHPFGELLKKLKAYRKNLPMKVSGIALEEFKNNFTRQGFRNDGGSVDNWKKRKSPDKREGKALLIKSGRLRRGFKKRPDYNTARVINDVPYAAAHNEGSTETVRVKSHKRRLKKITVRSTNIRSRKTHSKKMAVKGVTSVVKSHNRKNNLPARPFMKTTDALMKDIDKQILDDVTKLFDGTE